MAEILKRFLADLIAVITESTGDTMIISALVLLLVLGALVSVWLYNRRKFHNLSHQIPASIVKNYLDSIIQNSTSLKSSLFRGGGMDIGEGIPSVVPTDDLRPGPVSAASSEELNRKNAEISSLNSKLSDKDRLISDLEKRLADAAKAGGGDAVLQSEVDRLQKEKKDLEAKVKSLEEELAKAKANAGDPAALESITKERDALKERLVEYEIIEEDLANLKKLQQENETLKKELDALKAGGAVAAGAAAAAVASAPEPPPPAPEPEPPTPEPAGDDDLEAAMAAAIE
ncbi:MAG: hypothetical protein VXY34_06945, partial [Bdellovibrionota bacterium]|nr:hypothetical protein [Bdellovibrionota bacterium]